MSCEAGFKVYLTTTTSQGNNNWATNNRINHGYIQSCVYGMHIKADGNNAADANLVYGSRQNMWDLYIESCDYGVYFDGTGATGDIFTSYADVYNIKFDQISDNGSRGGGAQDWLKVEGSASGDAIPYATFFSKSNTDDILLYGPDTPYQYVVSADFTQVDLSRIRQIKPLGEERFEFTCSGAGQTYTPDATQARYFRFDVTDNNAFTIGKASNFHCDEEIIIDIYNHSGGAMGAITWNAGYKWSSTWANPAYTKHRLVKFRWDNEDQVWREVSCNTVDMDN
jgi:hypothetical protein